jgi:L-threonylcarbamoyladenylate synthase
MKIQKINQKNPEPAVIWTAAHFLKNEKVIIHPTETIYGLAGIYLSKKALHKIIEIKSRDVKLPFSIMVNSIDQIISIIGKLPRWMEEFLQTIYPAAITVLLPRKVNLPVSYWNQFPFLGFRYPKHHLSNLMVEMVSSPIITTSANLSGTLAPARINEIPNQLLEQVSITLDGGETELRIPSTVVKIDEKNRKLRLVRQGAVNWNTIEKCFGKII